METLSQVLSQVFSAAYVASAIRLATPILLAALGAIFTDRAGIMNLNLEGTMLAAALGAVLGSYYTGANVWVGLIVGIAVGAGISAIFAYVGIYLKANMVLAATALNLTVNGFTIYLLYTVAGEKGTSVNMKSGKLPQINIPVIKDIPVLGEIVSGHGMLTYVCVIAIFVASFILFKTAIGLRIRAVGESPEAAESVGINVKIIQFWAVVICGTFASLGGIHLSMSYLSWFQREMTAGRGYIALAAMTLGNSTPIGTMIAAFLFGMAEALGNVLQALKFPPQFVLCLPYVATLIGLVVIAIRKQAKIKKAQANR